MRKTKKIEKVMAVLYDSYGTYLQKDSFLKNIDEDNIEKGFFSMSNGFIYGYDEENLIIKKGVDFIFINKGYNDGCQIYKDNIISYKIDFENDTTSYYLKTKDSNLIFKIDGFYSCIYIFENNLYITDRKKYLSLYNLQKDFFEWQYTLPEGFTIFTQPQIIDNILFINSFKNGNEENFVVGLDIKTGEVLWQLLFKIPYKEQLLATTLHKENKLCYGYLGNLYQIFNPISGKIVLEKEMNKKINPYTNAIYDNKLWFVSGKYEECKFGYINLANNELELLQDFPQEDDETFEIVYHQKKLYLRGKYYNNLYIFEE